MPDVPPRDVIRKPSARTTCWPGTEWALVTEIDNSSSSRYRLFKFIVPNNPEVIFNSPRTVIIWCPRWRVVNIPGKDRGEYC